MKILQIGLEWFPEKGGGLDRIFYDFSRYLPTVGVEVNGLVAGSTNVTLDSGERVRAFACPNSPLWQRWQGIRQLTQDYLNCNHYDLITSHFALYSFPILDLVKNHPWVFHFHGPWALESHLENNHFWMQWLKYYLEKYCYQHSNHFIVLSQAFKRLLHQNYNIPLEKIEVVPGGVETKRFQVDLPGDKARHQFGWAGDRPIIFCVRRLTQRMGLENLITAIAKVKKYQPDILLYIAGTGKLAKTLQTQIQDLNLENHVYLLGYLSEAQLVIAYRAANFSIVPSIALEGFGLIILESLAAGTAVLGTPVGGIPEILNPLCPDLLLENSSSQALAQGIMEMLTGQRQLPTSQTCQDYVKNHYDWSEISRQVKTVYEKALVAGN